MTQVNVTDMNMSSLFPGIGNYKDVPMSFDIPATTIPVIPNLASFSRSFPLDNTNAISQLQFTFPGLDNNQYIHSGWLETLYDGSFLRTFNNGSAKLQMDIYAEYHNGQLAIRADLFNIDGISSINVPAFTVTCRARLFIPPYAT